jgi:hypothetical protein
MKKFKKKLVKGSLNNHGKSQKQFLLSKDRMPQMLAKSKRIRLTPLKDFQNQNSTMRKLLILFKDRN